LPLAQAGLEDDNEQDFVALADTGAIRSTLAPQK